MLSQSNITLYHKKQIDRERLAQAVSAKDGLDYPWPMHQILLFKCLCSYLAETFMRSLRKDAYKFLDKEWTLKLFYKYKSHKSQKVSLIWTHMNIP